MFVKMDINQERNDIYKEIVKKGNYVEFPSKWQHISYCMYYVDGYFYLEMEKRNRSEPGNSMTINEESIWEKIYEDDDDKFVFEIFFNKSFACIRDIENLKEK